MALPRFHSQTLRLAASILLAATGTQFTVPACSAERWAENVQIPAISKHLTRSAMVSAAVETVFRNRWLDNARQYSVDADDKVQTAHGALDDDDLERSNSVGTDKGGVKIYRQFAYSTIDAESSCGPSPLTSAEIARLVVEAAQRYQVDPAFALAVSTAESRLDRDRNSPKGARGPMQLMPSTAAFLGVTDICDPAENIDGGVRLLKTLFETYRNPLIVAAAFNAGKTNVEKYGGVPPFPETVRFVAEVINRQLGLATLEAKGEGARGTPDPKTGDDNATTGVLAKGKAREWVGGVMQF